MTPTIRRTRLALVLGVVVALAVIGAAAVLATSGTPGNPFEQGTNETGRLAPGVYANDTVNITRLLIAHRTRLRNEGFRTQTTVTSRANGSVVISSGQQVKATSNLSRVLVDQNRSDPRRGNVTATIFANETKTLVRFAVDGNESYQVRQRTQTQTVPPISRSTLTVFGEAAENFTVANVTGAGEQRRITLTATVTPDNRTGGPQTQVSMVVDEQGVIRSLNVRSGQPGGTQAIETQYRLQQLGVSTVRQPDWVSEIPANATVQTPAGGRPTTTR